LLFTQPIVTAMGFAPERRDPNSQAPSIRDPCEICGLHTAIASRYRMLAEKILLRAAKAQDLHRQVHGRAGS
jgi:hypothetical protein